MAYSNMTSCSNSHCSSSRLSYINVQLIISHLYFFSVSQTEIRLAKFGA